MSFAGFPTPPSSGPGPTPSPNTHDLLSTTHGDTVPSAPGVGNIVVAITGAWESVAPGSELDHLVIVGGVPTWSAQAGSGLGDVTGPSSAVDNSVARYNATTGKIIQGSQVFIDDNGNVSINGNTLVSGDLTVLGDIIGLDLSASGFVVGPASSTDDALAVYDGTTGELIKDSAITVTAGGSGLVLPGDLTVDGDTTLNNLDVTNNVTVSGDLTIAGDTTLNNLDVTNNVTISGSLTATGGITGLDLAASGFVVGPASSTDNALALYDGVTGELVKDSAITATAGGSGLVIPGTLTVTGTTNIALSELNLTGTIGDILYASGTDAFGNIGIGSTGEVLTVVAGIPAWAAASGGGASAGGVVPTTLETSATITITDADFLVALSGTTTVNLPATPSNGQRHTIKDSLGTAGSANVTINGNGSPIDNIASTSLVNNFEAKTVIYMGALGQWQLV